MLSLMLAALLQGGPVTPPPTEITDPDWRRVENAGDPLRFYPEKAQRAGMEGAATISCVVNAKGVLHDCSVLEETPANYGFGAAAVRMSVLFKMKPLTKGGEKVDGGVVRIPIRFSLPRFR